MKKAMLKITLSLLLIVTLGVNLKIPTTKANPNTIYVDDDNVTGPWNGTAQHPYQNITSALGYASPGDNIYVRNGTYHEHLTLSFEVSLTGEEMTNTVIDGDYTGDVISVTADNVNITGFTIRNSGSDIGDCGIQISSAHCNIYRNIIWNCYNGILIYYANYTSILDNNIFTNLYGIQLYICEKNIVSGNNISHNGYGIYDYSQATNSIFTANTIQNNSIGATFNFNSDNNTIYHNNFINNTQQLAITDTINKFDNGIEGNYWSNYNGTDEDQNGIGDSPYVIDANNQDKYPLMGTFSDFTVIYEKDTYHVSTISNSTISQFQFNETIRMLKFNVAGINNTSGFCRITIPEKLIPWPYIVLVDNEQVNATSLPLSNATHTFLYLTYNHSTREVKILSKPYYELLEKYNTLLENYQNLNSTYYQLLADYALLNQTYQQTLANYTKLLADYNTLNQTYWQVLANYTRLLANYTQLQADYKTLNQTHQEVLINYAKLQNEYQSLLEEHNSLNQTYQQALASYTELLTKHESLNQTYQQLMANHTKLQNNYSSIQTDYNTLLDQYNLLNLTYNKTESEYANTRTTLWYVSIAAITITVIMSSLTINYRRKSEEQKKIAEKYKSELERVSLIDTARAQFEADTQRRKEKIRKFQNKYGVTVRPRDTLEDIITSLELKKEKSQQ
jgi:parallel beta-helix repeat protein